MRAVGYFRESTPGDSTLAQQNRAFLEYCERAGYEVAGTFIDAASSNGRAPGFRELISYLRDGEEGVTVIVPTISALGDDVAARARRFFQLEGLGAHVTRIDAKDDDSAAAIVSAWGAKEGASALGDRVRAAMRKKAVKGEVLGRPPYGYKVGNRRRLELIPEEAVVVRYIFRLYLQEGMGIRLIARRLNEEGLKTRRGGNWSMVSIRDILRNRVYLGTYSRFGVRVAGSHPALVTPDDFHLVEDRLNARRTSYTPRVTSQFLLSGLALCGYCGNKLIGVSRKQTWKRRSGERVQNSYRYYQCESRTNQSVCSYHTRRAADLEDEVRAALGESPPSASEDTQHNGADVAGERDRLQARLKAVDKRIERYVDSVARGRMQPDKMRSLGLAAAADRLALEDAYESLERSLGAAADAGGRRRERDEARGRLLARWDAMRFAERQSALRECIEHVTVHDEGVSIALRA